MLRILAWIIVASAAIFFISGFFVAAEDTVGAAEAVGYFLGYQVAGLGMFAFLYILLGVFYRVNNREEG